ncbi:MAG: ribose-phosphate pyrophosphokinase [Oligoflexia bacterium]|nr:ribose-phosphate pyrophosphokinase [Oligoflexia bacterium]
MTHGLPTVAAAKLKIFSGNSSRDLALNIAKEMGIELGRADLKRFSDGEINLEIHENVRGCDVFMIQSACSPANDNYMELFIMLDALKRASAARITAVIPYYGYARQDRKVAPRAPISAKLMADLITAAGADRVLSVDLHAGQIQGFFDIPFDHLFSMPVLIGHLKENISGETVVVSPDAGGVERARAFAKRLGATIAIIDKRRNAPNEAKALHLIGDVDGKNAIILDDLIDTAGTLTQAVDTLINHGAKKVSACATHPVLSGPAVARIRDSQLQELVVTDTIPLSQEAKNCSKIRQLTVAPLLAEAIKRIHGNDSVSSLFI